jgi:hypothetical protein
MPGHEGMKSQREDIIYQKLCVQKSNGGEKIVFHFNQLHMTARDEMPALLPIEVQGLYRIQRAMERKET